ncbi:PAS domain-containing protein [Botrimarina sp.]|uniref:PAS domain-containing protein n=1 Tax=Botrimarina sp. TaxID=2795802 RepID=UPI0032ECA7DF
MSVPESGHTISRGRAQEEPSFDGQGPAGPSHPAGLATGPPLGQRFAPGGPPRDIPAGRPASVPLEKLAREAYQHVCDSVAAGQSEFPRLNGFEDCVHIKNAEGILVYVNDAHRDWFTPGASPLGRHCEAFLDPVIAGTAVKLDEMVMAGCPYIECEHYGPGPSGESYHMLTHKRSLRSLGTPGLAVLGLTRLLAHDGDGPTQQHVDLACAAAKFRALAESDREICRLTVTGVSSREVAERFDMTTRAIELRKQKAFAALGVGKAVDLTRLLVRLQDRGYLDLGL